MKHYIFCLILPLIIYAQSTNSTVYFYIFDSQCYDQYFQSFQIAPFHCYQYTISKLLGYLIIGLSLIMRVPQIISILKQKKLDGLSLFSFNMEYLTTALITAYAIYTGIPFSTYGQSVFLGIQNLIILILFVVYSPSKQLLTVFSYIILTIVISLAFLFQLVPNKWQEISIWLQLLVIVFARGSQAIKIYTDKTVGVLSMLPYNLALLGNLIRIFTTLTEAPQDIALLMNFVLPGIFCLIIIIEFYVYPSKDSKTQKKIN